MFIEVRIPSFSDESDDATNAMTEPTDSDETLIDVDDLLAARRQVAVVWSTKDVKSVRPDLDDDQAWKVLQQCREIHDCEIGFNWLLIETVADDPAESSSDG